jgi:hypothetical protein
MFTLGSVHLLKVFNGRNTLCPQDSLQKADPAIRFFHLAIVDVFRNFIQRIQSVTEKICGMDMLGLTHPPTVWVDFIMVTKGPELTFWLYHLPYPSNS